MKKGFSLIELVMAVVLAGIIIGPMIALFYNSTAKSPTTDYFDMAISLASSKMEETSNKKFSNIVSESSTPFSGSFSQFSSQVVVHCVASTEVEVSVDPTATNYKWIKVIVTSSVLPGGSIDLTNLATDVTNK